MTYNQRSVQNIASEGKSNTEPSLPLRNSSSMSPSNTESYRAPLMGSDGVDDHTQSTSPSHITTGTSPTAPTIGPSAPTSLYVEIFGRQVLASDAAEAENLTFLAATAMEAREAGDSGLYADIMRALRDIGVAGDLESEFPASHACPEPVESEWGEPSTSGWDVEEAGEAFGWGEQAVDEETIHQTEDVDWGETFGWDDQGEGNKDVKETEAPDWGTVPGWGEQVEGGTGEDFQSDSGWGTTTYDNWGSGDHGNDEEWHGDEEGELEWNEMTCTYILLPGQEWYERERRHGRRGEESVPVTEIVVEDSETLESIMKALDLSESRRRKGKGRA